MTSDKLAKMLEEIELERKKLDEAIDNKESHETIYQKSLKMDKLLEEYEEIRQSA